METSEPVHFGSMTHTMEDGVVFVKGSMESRSRIIIIPHKSWLIKPVLYNPLKLHGAIPHYRISLESAAASEETLYFHFIFKGGLDVM